MKNNHLALGGLFITLHLVFIFLSRILVGSELLLVIFLPLLSTIYSLKFKFKETCVFFFSTLLLCVIFEPISTLIYVLPALICGMSYGFLVKKDVKELSLVYASALAHSFSLFISFLFISLLFKEVSFFEIFSRLVNKEGDSFYACVYLILISLGVLESFVVHTITNNELVRLGYKEIKKEEETPMWINASLLISIVIFIILSFINPIFTCYIFPYMLAFIIPVLVEFIMLNKRKWIYLCVAFVGLISLFLTSYVNSIFYPFLILLMFLPVIVEKNVRVLYTKYSKYLNNGKNKIK